MSQTIESMSSIAGPFIGGIMYAIMDIKTFLSIAMERVKVVKEI
ncbi:hypothetical protein [Halothermothrix orenii]|nr:hypothetical protein [Halothermothrix orenii]